MRNVLVILSCLLFLSIVILAADNESELTRVQGVGSSAVFPLQSPVYKIKQVGDGTTTFTVASAADTLCLLAGSNMTLSTTAKSTGLIIEFASTGGGSGSSSAWSYTGGDLVTTSALANAKSVRPYTHAQIDLGESSYAWRNLYLVGDIAAEDITSSATIEAVTYTQSGTSLASIYMQLGDWWTSESLLVTHSDVLTSKTADWFAQFKLADWWTTYALLTTHSDLLTSKTAGWFLSAAQSTSLTAAMVEGDNVSDLVNDAGYITSSTIESGDLGANSVHPSNISSVTGVTGADADDVTDDNLDDLADVSTGDEATSDMLVWVTNWTTCTLNSTYFAWSNKTITLSATFASSITAAVVEGDNVSDLVNDAGYITSSSIAAGDLAANSVFLSNLQDDMESSLSNVLTMPVGSNDNSMTDPGADRILMWDESSNSPAWATANTNLSFDGTNLNASGGSGFSTGSVIWQIDEHFIGGRYDVTGSLGENGWRYDAINAGSIGPLGAYSNRFGVFRLRSGTNSNGGVAVSCTEYGVTAGEIYADSGLRIEWVVYLPALANWTNDYELLIGGFDNTSSATVTDGIYFLYDISRDDDWCAVTKDSTATITDTSTSVTATTWVTLRIDVISNASVKFYVNDVEVAENTTNIPSADDDDFAWAVMLNGTKGTSWRELYVDRTMMAWSEQ